MMWEVKRHNWSELQAERNAAWVPQVIESLLNCATEEEAWEAAELIDNNVVVQGWLFEAAPATAACLVIALPFCPPHCRLTILELLGHLCGAPLAPEGSEQYLLQTKSRAEVRKGFAVYLALLESGSLAECFHCVRTHRANSNTSKAIWLCACRRAGRTGCQAWFTHFLPRALLT
jgi:hypothetical protein